MNCLYCGSKTKVVNSRRQNRSNSVWRRRRCVKCSITFTSIETPDLSSTFLVEKSGEFSPFLSDLLYTDILMTISDRKDCYSAARELTNSVIKALIKSKAIEFTPRQIAAVTAKVLKRFDRRAFLRYSAEHPSLTS